jgi:long-subunit acyl-CoA synthetase (AMP-forming)
MVYLSPRNSIEGHLAVIDRCDCKLWVLPAQRLGRVDQILATRDMKIAHFPEQLELLNKDSVSEYPYERAFAEVRHEPFVVLHTSGSTGLPKPIVVSHGSIATPDAHHNLPPIEGRVTLTQFFNTPYRAYSTFPNFHVS